MPQGFRIVLWMLRGVGVVCVVLFAVLDKLPRNRWGGFRFCYTLADNEV